MIWGYHHFWKHPYGVNQSLTPPENEHVSPKKGGPFFQKEVNHLDLFFMDFQGIFGYSCVKKGYVSLLRLWNLAFESFAWKASRPLWGGNFSIRLQGGLEEAIRMDLQESPEAFVYCRSNTLPKTNISPKKGTISIGNTSSNHWFSWPFAVQSLPKKILQDLGTWWIILQHPYWPARPTDLARGIAWIYANI